MAPDRPFDVDRFVALRGTKIQKATNYDSDVIDLLIEVKRLQDLLSMGSQRLQQLARLEAAVIAAGYGLQSFATAEG